MSADDEDVSGAEQRQQRQKLARAYQAIQDMHRLENKLHRMREQLAALEAKNTALRALLATTVTVEFYERQIRDLKLELLKRDRIIAELRSR